MTWDWTQVSWTIGARSTHKAKKKTLPKKCKYEHTMNIIP